MKELSIEEKAEAYDEAIEQAEKELTVCRDMNCDAARQIFRLFPQLEESEDERIRRRLIQYFSTFKLGTFAGIEPKKIIDWLEKCGFKKAHNIESQDGLKGEQILANSTKTCKDEQKPYGKREECYDCQMNYGGTCKGSCAMKRGEQKLVEWSEEDKDMLRMLLEMINYASDRYQHDDKATDIKAWVLKSLKDRVGCEMNCTTTKEWSEEDNFMYNKIKNLLTDISLAPESINSLFDWLKSVKSRVQPKQEWSGKDERYVKDLADYFTGGHPLKYAEEDIADWFKSLKDRYAWKPSEEMLEALDIAIRVGIQLGSWEEKALRELQKQLKAL